MYNASDFGYYMPVGCSICNRYDCKCDDNDRRKESKRRDNDRSAARAEKFYWQYALINDLVTDSE